MGNHVIILAAGQGSRMASDTAKVLHEVAGFPLIAHALRAAEALAPERVIVVTGHEAAAVEAAVAEHAPEATCVRQTEQLGTGHAVLQAEGALAGAEGQAFVLYGDTPFIRAETLEAMAEAPADFAVLGFEGDPAARYGRLVTSGDVLERIVEWKDADETTRAGTLMNSGVLRGDVQAMLQLLREVGNDNAAGEYYLTDLPALAASRGLTTHVVRCDEAETLGINTRAELARAEAAFQARARAEALETGVTLVAPDTVHFALDTHIGRDALIEQHVVFGPGVTVESGARIRAFSHLEGAHVSRGATVGPYARLRPGAELSEDVHVGNFVEVKNALIAEGAKVNHLSYIGDADIGERTNIGAGTITCNYDGVFKHRTVVGARAFIGSNTMLVAPVNVGDEAVTGSGSVITADVAAGDLALGRARQVAKPGLGRKMMERLRALKAKG
ncbi:bifunctional UDP-N-acetylglucosamine diphosphorylase/glucosamine-1-phosphate N-acetyltransferase GlmU [Pseudoroseicyclus tamaricis]|uniref:Bifunctional protein GlmU n=1 Tax=Pseudoroseicyclus tamaricis TaxID=2705421 RepID=A0A6B2JUS6_9RHOB|nr:bifunctional UDP-N-acetylglucosamine diphosphorylase/glucosamine-1-phosphate N-acetyltransferase GlmU [Pseudoroseicyclus tamaricis]NDV01655.1 bifunctional UDP-N-acetylglucosamine diphosphorylase/glucosamine-1-phosphate N-acetyltransferase GlmU [Pseudoroseicyclus tamaricis]